MSTILLIVMNDNDDDWLIGHTFVCYLVTMGNQHCADINWHT